LELTLGLVGGADRWIPIAPIKKVTAAGTNTIMFKVNKSDVLLTNDDDNGLTIKMPNGPELAHKAVAIALCEAGNHTEGTFVFENNVAGFANAVTA
jgi:hypothetical protein